MSTQDLIDGRYQLVRKIGAGGMATVWLAEDERLQRRVAIKRIHTEAPEDAAQRLVREAKLGAALNHPHVVTTYDALPDEGGVLIVMEYVDGHDLGRELDAGPLDQARALAILRAVASAVDHAHERGIVHRDVKPSNVLLGANGVVKLTDLGIARALEDTGITRSGVIVGSPPFMAPEQLAGGPVGPPADIYSLALIAYEALSGRRARADASLPQIAHQVSHEPPPDIREVRPQTPAPAARLLQRALDPDPSRRPGSATAFVRDLEDGLSAEPGAVPPPATPPRYDVHSVREPRPPARWLPLLALAAVVAAVVAVAALTGGESPEQAQQAANADQPRSGNPEAGSAGASESPGAPAGEPTEAVEDFYSLAAAGDTAAAWELASPNLRAQLLGYQAFEEQQATLRSIEFPSLETTAQTGDAATVAFSTVATHSDHTDACTGAANLVASDGGWLVDELVDITCRPG